jgi:hypothetical protein
VFDVTASQVCVSGYSSSVRSVSDAEKNKVYSEYGIASHATGQYEVDHFVPLELGGSNDIINLWPEPANPTPGFHQKDVVENYLHKEVCSGVMSLAHAQNLIETNWMAVYTSIGGSSGSSNSSGGSGSTAQPKPTEIRPTSTPGGSGHPAGTSGQCVDRTYTEAKHKQGACSHHGGVQTWWGS